MFFTSRDRASIDSWTQIPSLYHRLDQSLVPSRLIDLTNGITRSEVPSPANASFSMLMKLVRKNTVLGTLTEMSNCDHSISQHLFADKEARTKCLASVAHASKRRFDIRIREREIVRVHRRMREREEKERWRKDGRRHH